jgi:hypothetical protein
VVNCWAVVGVAAVAAFEALRPCTVKRRYDPNNRGDEMAVPELVLLVHEGGPVSLAF